MEPFEPFQSPSSTSTNSKSAALSNTNPSSKTNDWSSDWSNSFEPNPSDNKPGKTTTSNDSKLGTTSSYNWSNSNAKNTGFLDDKTKNEEDLFSSLVKDVSISKVCLSLKPTLRKSMQS